MSAPHHRRRLPRPVLRLGALLLTLVVVSGCASAVQEARRVADEPRVGGTLHVGTASDLSPPQIFAGTNPLIPNVYDSLVDYSLDSLEPKPVLATGWKLAPDGRSLSLDLRRGVRFHSGREFTSADVEFSIRTWADPAWAVQFQRTAAAITGFDTSGPRRITLRFAHRLSNIFDLLATMPIIDSASIDEFRHGTAYIGTGPFEFESWEPGSQYVLTRNEDYWGQKTYLDGVEVKIIPDAQAQVSQLRAGQLDMILEASKRDLETLGTDERYRVERWKGSEAQIYVGANVSNPALSDVRIRRAIAHALDRDRIVEEVYRGGADPAALPWPPYSPAYDDAAADRYPYDLDRAENLLKEYQREHGAPPTLPLTYPAEDGDQAQVAQIVQQDLEKVGIPVELDPQERGTVLKLLIAGKFEGLWIYLHTYGQFTPSTLPVSAFPFNGEHNASNYVDRSYQRAADRVWQLAPAAAGRPEAYKDLNRELLDGAFLLEIATIYPETATTIGVGGISRTKRSEPLFGRAYLGE